MQFQLGLLFLLAPLICADIRVQPIFDDAIWDPNITKPYAKYDVTVWKGKDVWLGVIISKFFVLSADHYKNPTVYIPSLLKISTDRYVNHIDVEASLRNTATFHEVQKTWVFEHLLIIRTKLAIRFDPTVLRIPLPSKAQVALWKDPCNLPNHQKFTITYWCIIKTCTTYRLKITDVFRKCSKGQVCPNEKFLIPSCFSVKTPGYKCEFVAGGPLVYNNTLVGLRKFSVTLDPYSENFEEDFINVSAYVDIINSIMSNELQCYARS